jgi:hypothetical protein
VIYPGASQSAWQDVSSNPGIAGRGLNPAGPRSSGGPEAPAGKGCTVSPSAGPAAGRTAAAKPAAAGLRDGQPLAARASGSGEPSAGPASARDIKSLPAALKLPGGELSVSILSFAKFFSLPLDGPFLGKVRQKALAGGDRPPPLPGKGLPPASVPQFREALALAALASAAKGLELSPEALAAYARALLHGQVSWEEADNPGGEGVPAGTAEDSRAAESPPAEADGPVESVKAEGKDAAGGRGSGTAGDSGGKEGGCGSGKKEAGGRGIPGDDPAVIRDLALTAQGPLLGILNRLPGKDGRRWIVLPFSLEGLDICLRILLAGSQAELMGLDIRDGEGVWRFILRPGYSDSGGQKARRGAPPWSLELCQSPAPAGGRAEVPEQELAEFLGLPAGGIRVQGAPVFAESRDWILPLVNEEV